MVKIIFNGSVINDYIKVLAGNLKIGKPMFCCYFFQAQHRFLYMKH